MNIRAALAVAVSVIAAEHFFSAGMSSPWSVAKFANTQKDANQVWKLFWYGTIASILFAVIIGAMINGKKAVLSGVISAGAVSAFMGFEYHQALSGKL